MVVVKGELKNREFIPCLSLFDATRQQKNAETNYFVFSFIRNVNPFPNNVLPQGASFQANYMSLAVGMALDSTNRSNT